MWCFQLHLEEQVARLLIATRPIIQLGPKGTGGEGGTGGGKTHQRNQEERGDPHPVPPHGPNSIGGEGGGGVVWGSTMGSGKTGRDSIMRWNDPLKPKFDSRGGGRGRISGRA